jgi:hypothetical protein
LAEFGGLIMNMQTIVNELTKKIERMGAREFFAFVNQLIRMWMKKHHKYTSPFIFYMRDEFE